MEIRALGEGDDRLQFRSGDGDLDQFFHRFAGQNQFRRYLGVTYVAVEGPRILGFATVASGHVLIDRLPPSARRGLPQYPLPILRLARLAVDESARGLGLGAALLRYVLRLALRMAPEVGCIGVVVDAKETAVDFYAQFGFVQLEAIAGGSDARPPPIPMFLPLAAVRRAIED